MRRLRSLALGAGLVASAAASLAGSAASFFQVQITLHTGIPDPVVSPDPVAVSPPVVVLPTSPPAPGTDASPFVPPVAGLPPLPVNPGAGGGTPVVPMPDTSAGTAVPPVVPTAGPPSPAVAIAAPAPATLPLRGGVCTSQSQSAATHATVRVVCSTGQFASIEPTPGQPFAGTHGGAYRFNFGPGLPLAAGLGSTSGLHIGAGTVTALRVVNLAGRTDPLEMLVSF